MEGRAVGLELERLEIAHLLEGWHQFLMVGAQGVFAVLGLIAAVSDGA